MYGQVLPFQDISSSHVLAAYNRLFSLFLCTALRRKRMLQPRTAPSSFRYFSLLLRQNIKRPQKYCPMTSKIEPQEAVRSTCIQYGIWPFQFYLRFPQIDLTAIVSLSINFKLGGAYFKNPMKNCSPYSKAGLIRVITVVKHFALREG